MAYPTIHCRSARPVSTTRRPRSAQRAAGLTLVELTVSMAVMGLVALGVASMLMAVSSGTRTGSAGRALLVQEAALRARLTNTVRASRQILALGEYDLVLWVADRDGSEAPNLRELVHLRYDPDTDQLVRRSASFPEFWDDDQVAAVDTAYEMTADFLTVAEDLDGTEHWAEQRWTSGLSAWSLRADQVDANAATAIAFTLTVDRDGEQTSFRVAAAMENRPQ